MGSREQRHHRVGWGRPLWGLGLPVRRARSVALRVARSGVASAYGSAHTGAKT